MVNTLLFVGILLAVLIFFALPGFLLWRLLNISKKIDYSYLVSVGLGFAMVIFLFTTTASVYKYNFWLMLFENIILIIMLFSLLFYKKRFDFIINAKNIMKQNSNLILLLVFAFTMLIASSLIITVPFDTDAQGFGFYALTTREGGTVDTLSPFFNDVKYLYSPAYFVMTAFLSDLLGKAPIHEVMLAFSHLTAFFFILAVYHLGRKLFDKRSAFFMTLFCIAGIGLFTSLLDSHYTTILAFLFLASFLPFFFISLREPSARSVLLSGLFLGSICLSHPDTLIILLISWIPFYALIFLSKEKISRKNYLISFFAIPIIGIIFSLPWLLTSLNLFFSPDIISSPILLQFGTSLNNWVKFIVFQGIFVPLMAAGGLFYALRRRKFEDVFMVLWILSIIEFSMIGIVEWLGKNVGFDITHHFYAPNIAWAGPIIPFAFLAALFVHSFVTQKKKVAKFFAVVAKPVFVLATLLCIIIVLFSPAAISISKKIPIKIFGTFSTEDDVNAMLWIKSNTPKDAIILNYPLKYEGHWVPVISERHTIANRVQPFFINFSDQLSVQQEFSNALERKNFSRMNDLILENNVSFIILPQLSTNVSAYDYAQRWSRPKLINMTDFLDSSGIFNKVYDYNGAVVYEVKQ